MSTQMCKQDGSRSHSRKAMTPRRNSLQLWTPKMKNRDERKRIISMCLAKIKKIEDRDSCLLRSVLVTNILKKLQKESENEPRQVPSATPTSSLSGSRTERPSSNDLDFDTDILNFNEFYLPPTPRMISSLEDDEVLELALRPVQKEIPLPPIPVPEPVFERALTDEETLEQLVTPSLPIASLSEVKLPQCQKRPREDSSNESEEKRPRVENDASVVSSVNSNEFEVDRTFTCAQSSMFCDLHNAVFHGIMTSLES